MTPAAQNPGADSLRAVLHGVFAQPDFHWVVRLTAWQHVSAWLTAAGRWLSAFADQNPLLFRIGFGLIAAVILGILAYTAWVFSGGFRRAPVSIETASGPAPTRDLAWYRAEADRLALTGRFADAMQADFIALVFALDARQLLRFHPSKTPAEYAAEARFGATARSEFGALVGTLYQVAFGGAPISQGEFAAWRRGTWPEHYAPAE